MQPVPGDPDFPVFAEGEAARHNDLIWVSLVADNVWEPGVANWREYFQPDGGGGLLYPEWRQPTGAGDAYGIGERVSYASPNFPATLIGNPRSQPIQPYQERMAIFTASGSHWTTPAHQWKHRPHRRAPPTYP